MTNLPSETPDRSKAGNPSPTPDSRQPHAWSLTTAVFCGFLGGIGVGILGMLPVRQAIPHDDRPDAVAPTGTPAAMEPVPTFRAVPPGPRAGAGPMRIEGVATPPPEPAAKAVPKATPLQALLLPKPDYPALARKAGLQGPVDVTLTVGPEGVPTVLTTSGANRILEKAALEAATECRFAPATRAGRPVPATFLVHYEFRLHPEPESRTL
ncbi:energy transducer TonB [Geothrix sp. 21YS21S-2]|uniref:energy transducer TonB n=1 Tax=Geothrix sp. 21YS21S-2 TaxID=3068893 RepID=UPI0027BAC331|nr:energy transducer TonB [Geothrix sp. 21YS21S-2]